MSHTMVGRASVTTLRLGYAKGLNTLNSEVDPADIEDTDPHAQFDKLSIAANMIKPFTLFKAPFVYRGTLYGQYSKRQLHASERINIGDLYTVRGFKEDSIQGDVGLYVRNDVSIKLNHIISWRPLKEMAERIDFNLSLDAGYVNKQDGLVGMSIGLKYHGALTWKMTYGLPLVWPESMDANDHEFYFSVTI